MTRQLAADRLVGLDVARCLALLGMVATHVLLARGPDGDLALPQAIAGGRAGGTVRGARRGVAGAHHRPPRSGHGPRAGGQVAGDRGPSAADRAGGPLPGRPGLGAGDHPHLLRPALPARTPVRRPACPGAVRPDRRLDRGRTGGLTAGAARAAATRLRQPDLRPARRPGPAAERAPVHRLLPGRAVAGLPARRDGARTPRPGEPRRAVVDHRARARRWRWSRSWYRGS